MHLRKQNFKNYFPRIKDFHDFQHIRTTKNILLTAKQKTNDEEKTTKRKKRLGRRTEMSYCGWCSLRVLSIY